ncbi:hypothetical protein ABEB36_015721 [Hypothenemus hampei]|uniref:Uncharacterized protein n=1 Tax=Hypothenemus hampei TaxID=57062 RepID=A0ABD1DZ36_HYPHA
MAKRFVLPMREAQLSFTRKCHKSGSTNHPIMHLSNNTTSTIKSREKKQHYGIMAKVIIKHQNINQDNNNQKGKKKKKKKKKKEKPYKFKSQRVTIALQIHPACSRKK